MSYAGWEAIDRAEKAAGEPHGRPRVKLCSFEELLEAAKRRYAGALTASPSSASSARSTELRDAGEDRRLRLGVGARLGRAQLLHEVEELGRVVGVEGHHELLVVEAERVGRVDLDPGEAARHLDVVAHDPHPLLGGSRYHSRFFHIG